MSYIAATHLDKDTWAKGINWMRKAKSAGLTGFIIGSELPDEAEAKTKELGFKLVQAVTGQSLFSALADNTKKGQRCLFTTCESSPKGGLSEARDATCRREKSLDAMEIVFPIKNLKNRAKSVWLLRDKIEKTYKGLLSPQQVLGTWDFWTGLAGFQNYLYQKNYLDRGTADNTLVFNLYVALAESVSLEIDDD